MAKLRVVKKDESPTPSRLVATQIVAIQGLDGQTGLVMLDISGNVYTYLGSGWARLNMVEVPHDTPPV